MKYFFHRDKKGYPAFNNNPKFRLHLWSVLKDNLYPKPGEHIHHVDQNKCNFKSGNLIIMPKHFHYRLHEMLSLKKLVAN